MCEYTVLKKNITASPRGLLCAFAASAGFLHAQVEDAVQRSRLPEYTTIPAALPQEQTPSNGLPAADSMRTWTVSHGDSFADRYSALAQINRENVKNLREAWTFHSGDATGNIQANPIVVDGVMFGPTPGRAIVAIDASNGTQLWRFQLEAVEQPRIEDSPARRGLVYWQGTKGHPARIVFSSGDWVYALDPKSGRPMADFGVDGRAPLPTGGTAVGVIWRGTYIVPGLLGDVFAYTHRHRPRAFGVSTPSLNRARRARTRGREPGMATERIAGEACPSTRNAASSLPQLGMRCRISSASTASETIFTRTASCARRSKREAAVVFPKCSTRHLGPRLPCPARPPDRNARCPENRCCRVP